MRAKILGSATVDRSGPTTRDPSLRRWRSENGRDTPRSGAVDPRPVRKPLLDDNERIVSLLHRLLDDERTGSEEHRSASIGGSERVAVEVTPEILSHLQPVRQVFDLPLDTADLGSDGSLGPVPWRLPMWSGATRSRNESTNVRTGSRRWDRADEQPERGGHGSGGGRGHSKRASASALRFRLLPARPRSPGTPHGINDRVS